MPNGVGPSLACELHLHVTSYLACASGPITPDEAFTPFPKRKVSSHRGRRRLAPIASPEGTQSWRYIAGTAVSGVRLRTPRNRVSLHARKRSPRNRWPCEIPSSLSAGASVTLGPDPSVFRALREPRCSRPLHRLRYRRYSSLHQAYIGTTFRRTSWPTNVPARHGHFSLTPRPNFRRPCQQSRTVARQRRQCERFGCGWLGLQKQPAESCTPHFQDGSHARFRSAQIVSCSGS